MFEPKQHTLEDDERFLVSFIMLALGNGILIAIVLMVWRNQALMSMTSLPVGCSQRLPCVSSPFSCCAGAPTR